MQREKLEEQKNILRQIAKASDSIRRKHRMIKLGKENVEHAMSEVFKPVVTPLQKLVNVFQTEHNTIKDKIKDEIKDEMKHNVGMNDTFETTNESFHTLKNDSTIGEISDIQDDDIDDDDDDDDDGDDGYKNDMDLPVNQNDSMQRKHRMIKLGKENVEHAMSEVFKPVVTPLQKLVNVFQTEHNTIKDKIKDEIKDEIKHNVGINDTFETTNESFNTLKNDSTIGEISDIQDDDDDDNDDDYDGDDGHKNDVDLPVNQNDSMQRYLSMLLSRQNKQLDTTYGVRKLSKKKLMVGDSPISFEGDQIHIGDTSYPKTNSLIELLFRKIPNENHSSVTDKGIIPRYMIGAKDRLTDYVYWDDPNELVDRLRLLLASQEA
ncbi:coiled-coil domain-containing protein 1-like, partial [Cephus cinctus]|uniref:Coiled-coil domain-containing protein 1-like n=1 Tax=Cephus cinctus TaxID=211228 RepID=A0AAJ7CFF3_CEPCN